MSVHGILWNYISPQKQRKKSQTWPWLVSWRQAKNYSARIYIRSRSTAISQNVRYKKTDSHLQSVYPELEQAHNEVKEKYTMKTTYSWKPIKTLEKIKTENFLGWSLRSKTNAFEYKFFVWNSSKASFIRNFTSLDMMFQSYLIEHVPLKMSC